jgi:DNA (cytosine-5)-methyltransferase 1
VVSFKERRGKCVPVIDINSMEKLHVFAGMRQVRVVICEGEIHIMLSVVDVKITDRVDRLLCRLANREPLEAGSISHGGGVLSLAVHAGFEDAGVPMRLAFANEIREELANHAEGANPVWDGTIPLAAPMQELAHDDWVMSKLPKVDVLEAGIPCQGASLSGRAKNAIAKPEDHPEVGHLIASFLTILSKVNPSVVIFENVPPYGSTASASILRTTLRDWGYETAECVLDGAEFNTIEHRQRFCLVAVTKGLAGFDFGTVQKPEKVTQRLGDILENVPDESDAWKDVPYLHAKADRDKEAGKGFKMQIVTRESASVGTIGKGYAKWRSTEPLVSGNERFPEKLRLLTPNEHARVKGIPERLIDGLPATTAHEVLGQSVLFEPFRAVSRAIAATLKTSVQERIPLAA